MIDILSFTDLGAFSGRTGKFFGLHFFNPVHVMKLVEGISGLDTQKVIIDEVKAVVKKIKKIPIAVRLELELLLESKDEPDMGVALKSAFGALKVALNEAKELLGRFVAKKK